MSLSNNYLGLYDKYLNEIDEIKKNLKVFKSKKNTALKKSIFAPDDEVLELENSLFGTEGEEQTKDVKDENEPNHVFIEHQKEKLKKNKNLADVLTILDDSEDDKLRDAKENDMIQIYRFKNGDMYIGRLLDGKITGIGSYIFSPDNDENEGNINTEYIGNFSNGKREGKGIFTFSNGNEYIGNFSNNKSNGIGRMRYNNGDEYLGNWVNGKKNGLGIYTWADGYMYMGEFKDSKMDGIGSCFTSKGELVYEGEWKRGQIHGKGKYLWSKNKWYEGEFQQGQKHGYGVFYLDNSAVYTGTWKYDKPSIFDKSFEEVVSCLENY